MTLQGIWNDAVIRDLFPPAEANRIMKMTVGNFKDHLIWAYTNNGSYTVKSGYWFVSNNHVIPLPLRTMIEEVRLSLKQRIWKLQTLPKIRVFLWRVISGLWL